MKNGSIPKGEIVVWDRLIRFSHLLYILLLPLLYWTAHEGMMDIHQYLGITVLLLVAFRVCWGFWGSHSARFSTFLVSPEKVLQYGFSFFKRHSQIYLTHNPMGGYMVVVILALLAIQGILGLFGTDDIIFEGPLASWVSYDLSVELTGWHHWLFNLILAAIVLHIFAVLWYQFYKRQGLIQSMIHGRKTDSHQ